MQSQHNQHANFFSLFGEFHPTGETSSDRPRQLGLSIGWIKSVALLAFIFNIAAHGVEVEAEGKAAGNFANAREQALTDALRDAVRKGAGVDILSESNMRDFVLEYDRIFAASFGYVRSYSILSSGLGGDGIYRVKIHAEVEQGEPHLRDDLALRQLVRLKRSPRIALDVREVLEGVTPPEASFAGVWFESAIQAMQLQVVNVAPQPEEEILSTRVDAVDESSMERRSTPAFPDADYLIRVLVRARHLGERNLRGISVQLFSLSADLRVLRPDTGQVLISVPLPGEEVPSRHRDVQTAARQLIHALLEGDAERGIPGGWTLFRKIFAHWLVELDLGTVIRLDFAKITDAELDKLVQLLKETPQISAVWLRAFDIKGISSLDVETRLDPTSLKIEALNALNNNTFAFERATRNYLRFSKVPPTAASDGSQRSAEKEKGDKPGGPLKLPLLSMPRGWAWTLISTGAALISSGMYALIRGR